MAIRKQTTISPHTSSADIAGSSHCSPRSPGGSADLPPLRRGRRENSDLAGTALSDALPQAAAERAGGSGGAHKPKPRRPAHASRACPSGEGLVALAAGKRTVPRFGGRRPDRPPERVGGIGAALRHLAATPWLALGLPPQSSVSAGAGGDALSSPLRGWRAVGRGTKRSRSQGASMRGRHARSRVSRRTSPSLPTGRVRVWPPRRFLGHAPSTTSAGRHMCEVRAWKPCPGLEALPHDWTDSLARAARAGTPREAAQQRGTASTLSPKGERFLPGSLRPATPVVRRRPDRAVPHGPSYPGLRCGQTPSSSRGRCEVSYFSSPAAASASVRSM
jgi:hypothetical protein